MDGSMDGKLRRRRLALMRLSVLAVSAIMLGIALIGCQPQPVPPPSPAANAAVNGVVANGLAINWQTILAFLAANPALVAGIVGAITLLLSKGFKVDLSRWVPYLTAALEALLKPPGPPAPPVIPTPPVPGPIPAPGLDWAALIQMLMSLLNKKQAANDTAGAAEVIATMKVLAAAKDEHEAKMAARAAAPAQ